MSHNPFSNPDLGNPADFHDYNVAPRTSLLSIASLVLGILSLVTCCVGGAVPGVPAAALGIGAIFVINSKNGRLVGRGMAISGIVMGTLGLFLNIIGALLLSKYVGFVAGATTQPMRGIEAADVRPLQDMLNADAAARLDEPTMLAFRKEYQDRLGAFKSVDTNLINFVTNAWNTYGTKVGALQIDPNRHGVPIPIDGYFENGTAEIWLFMPSNYQANPGSTPKIVTNIAIVPETGTPIFLLPLQAAPAPGTSGGSAPTPPANPDPSATPPAPDSAPKPEEAPATPPTGG